MPGSIRTSLPHAAISCFVRVDRPKTRQACGSRRAGSIQAMQSSKQSPQPTAQLAVTRPGAAPGPAPAIALPAASVCPTGTLTVLYDGSCPLCRREIALYQGMKADQPLAFVDVSDAAVGLPPGTQRERLLARFHVQRADGSLADGARGFVAVWAALPGWRWLARLASLPGVTGLMELAYRGFLLARPAMQRLAGAFEPATLHVPAAMRGDLRSDHAGETGAVWIYRGVLAVARDNGVRAFAQRHLATEEEHLRLITPLLPWPQRSRLLVPWRLAGFLTGALPALAGPRAVYATIAAVETFVDHHYRQQLDRIDALPAAERADTAPLRFLLAACQADECAHRDEAQARRDRPPGPMLRGWCAAVGIGSKAAVALARRV